MTQQPKLTWKPFPNVPDDCQHAVLTCAVDIGNNVLKRNAYFECKGRKQEVVFNNPDGVLKTTFVKFAISNNADPKRWEHNGNVHWEVDGSDLDLQLLTDEEVGDGLNLIKYIKSKIYQTGNLPNSKDIVTWGDAKEGFFHYLVLGTLHEMGNNPDHEDGLVVINNAVLFDKLMCIITEKCIEDSLKWFYSQPTNGFLDMLSVKMLTTYPCGTPMHLFNDDHHVEKFLSQRIREYRFNAGYGSYELATDGEMCTKVDVQFKALSEMFPGLLSKISSPQMPAEGYILYYDFGSWTKQWVVIKYNKEGKMFVVYDIGVQYGSGNKLDEILIGEVCQKLEIDAEEYFFGSSQNCFQNTIQFGRMKNEVGKHGAVGGVFPQIQLFSEGKSVTLTSVVLDSVFEQCFAALINECITDEQVEAVQGDKKFVMLYFCGGTTRYYKARGIIAKKFGIDPTYRGLVFDQTPNYICSSLKNIAEYGTGLDYKFVSCVSVGSQYHRYSIGEKGFDIAKSIKHNGRYYCEIVAKRSVVVKHPTNSRKRIKKFKSRELCILWFEKNPGHVQHNITFLNTFEFGIEVFGVGWKKEQFLMKMPLFSKNTYAMKRGGYNKDWRSINVQCLPDKDAPLASLIIKIPSVKTSENSPVTPLVKFKKSLKEVLYTIPNHMQEIYKQAFELPKELPVKVDGGDEQMEDDPTPEEDEQMENDPTPEEDEQMEDDPTPEEDEQMEDDPTPEEDEQMENGPNPEEDEQIKTLTAKKRKRDSETPLLEFEPTKKRRKLDDAKTQEPEGESLDFAVADLLNFIK